MNSCGSRSDFERCGYWPQALASSAAVGSSVEYDWGAPQGGWKEGATVFITTGTRVGLSASATWLK